MNGASRTLDLGPLLGPARDQGPRGTCLAFASTAAHEARLSIGIQDQDMHLSEELLYWAAKKVDGNSQSGTTFKSVSRALATPGQPPEEYWPYDINRDDSTQGYGPPASATDPSICNAAIFEPADRSITAILDALRQRRVLVIGFPLWREFSLPHRDGSLDLPTPVRFQRCYHAVAVVGFADSRRLLRIRNSWGTAWGDNGHAWLPYDFCRYITDVWWIR